MSLFTLPVSAAQAGLLGSSPEDVPHSSWLLDLFGTQFQSRGAGIHGGEAGWAWQGVELNLWSTDDTWALTVGKLIRSCGVWCSWELHSWGSDIGAG